LVGQISAAQAPGQPSGRKETPVSQDSFYRLTTRTLEGQPADLGTYAGRVALVVNVASQCGYTPQYTGLEKLYRDLKDRGFVVLGFPSNDFGGQEPGTAPEIRQFCSLNYDVTFPLFEKVVTRAGAAQSPLYANLQKQSGQLPGWNFAKYLVGKDGRVVKFYKSGVTPEDAGLREDIEAALR
jgi:glutathione peroxidase